MDLFDTIFATIFDTTFDTAFEDRSDVGGFEGGLNALWGSWGDLGGSWDDLWGSCLFLIWEGWKMSKEIPDSRRFQTIVLFVFLMGRVGKCLRKFRTVAVLKPLFCLFFDKHKLSSCINFKYLEMRCSVSCFEKFHFLALTFMDSERFSSDK